jgi:IclR family acetate operon transcriptional repressor
MTAMSPDKVKVMARSAARPDGVGGMTPPQYPIESVDNALRVLLLFEEQQQIRLTEASTYLGVASSTAHRLMAMLQYRGFVRQNPVTRAYEPGPALSSIALGIMGRLDVRATVRPLLERLHRDFAETVHLGRLEGQNVHFVDSIEGTRAVRVGSRAGRSLPAHVTSTGKAMLSLLDTEALHSLYPGEELEAVTDKSLTHRSQLEEALEAIRREGYATSNEESEEGVASVAVPIRGMSGVLYAVNVSVPKHRVTSTLQREIAASLLRAGEELGGLLV